MRRVLLLSIFFSFNLLASEYACHIPQYDQATQSLASLPSINSMLSCDVIGQIRTQDKLEQAISYLALEQKSIIYNKKLTNRHQIGEQLRDCSAQKNSKGLIISFEGTGAYDPYTFDIQYKLLKCLDVDQLPPKLRDHIYNKIRKYAKKHVGAAKTKWSGVEAGPIAMLTGDPDLNKIAKQMTIANFPSEESELLADSSGLTIDNIKKIPKDFIRSSAGMPKGMHAAITCTKQYLKEAKKNAVKNPKIIVLSHSSGGRTAVKFNEYLKKIYNPLTYTVGVDIDLTFTIDPVKEAHHAIQDIVSQHTGNILRDVQRKFDDSVPKNKPLTVWSKKQPKSLYKTSNTKKWVNVYQNVDTKGLKAGIIFGICGSPINNADVNQYIKKGLGSAAHGEIAYCQKTKDLFKENFSDLFKP